MGITILLYFGDDAIDRSNNRKDLKGYCNTQRDNQKWLYRSSERFYS